jgi:hypothetical protein
MDDVLSAENGQVGTQFDGPGHIGIAAANWLAQRGIALVIGDTWPVEAVPNPKQAFPVGQILIPKNGTSSTRTPRPNVWRKRRSTSSPTSSIRSP